MAKCNTQIAEATIIFNKSIINKIKKQYHNTKIVKIKRVMWKLSFSLIVIHKTIIISVK